MSPWPCPCVVTGIAAPSTPSKKNGARGLLARRDLVQARQRVEAAVLHHVDDAVGLADVDGRVAVDDDQVGQLADLQRADVLVHAEVVRAVDRGVADRLQRRHAALDLHPHVPVRAQALALAVRAQVLAHAGVQQLGGGLRDADHVVVLLAARSRGAPRAPRARCAARSSSGSDASRPRSSRRSSARRRGRRRPRCRSACSPPASGPTAA